MISFCKTGDNLECNVLFNIFLIIALGLKYDFKKYIIFFCIRDVDTKDCLENNLNDIYIFYNY